MKAALASPQASNKATPRLPGDSNVLRRKCTCESSPGTGGTCAQCGKRKLQRREAGQGGTAAAARSGVPQVVHDVLRSPGQPLAGAARAFMEPRFGHDFSHVRIHTDAKAAESARSVNALAYTVGQHVVFGAGRYAPATSEGRRTLAHELSHVVQNRFAASAPSHTDGLIIGPPGDALEQEADAAADTVMRTSATAVSGAQRGFAVQRTSASHVLHRRMVVNTTDTIPSTSGTPTRLTTAVGGLLNDTCPDGHFQVDAMTGEVSAKYSTFCQDPPPPVPFLTPDVSSTPVGCGCLCEVVNSGQTATIAFRAGGPGTSPGSVPGAGAGQGGARTSSTVNIDPRFQGQYLISGRWVDVPFHLLFSHELCGHALPKMKGTHVPRGAGRVGGTPPQEQHAVDVERQIAAEHSPPLPRRPDDYSGGARQRP